MAERLSHQDPKEAAIPITSHETYTLGKLSISKSEIQFEEKPRIFYHQGKVSEAKLLDLKRSEAWAKNPLLLNNLTQSKTTIHHIIAVRGAQQAAHLKDFEKKPGVYLNEPLFALIQQEALRILFEEAKQEAKSKQSS